MSRDLIAATTMQPTLLCSVQAANGTSTLYTVPAATSIRLTQGVLCNVSAAAVTVSLAIVPSGGAIDGTHRVIDTYSLAAHDTLSLRDYIKDLMLGPGDFIGIVVSAASAIDVIISGLVSA